MSLSKAEFDEFQDLIDAVCNDELTLDRLARFQELAKSSAQARQFYLLSMRLHARMQWYFRAPVFAEADSWSNVSRPVPRFMLARRAAGAIARAVKSPKLLLCVILVALTGYFAAVYGWLSVPRFGDDAVQLGENRAGAAGAVATLTATHYCEWVDESEPLKVGAPLSGRVLTLASGVAELTFAGGARVTFEGPAKLDLQSTSRGFLHRGRLHADVPRQAIGFTIETPTAVVVDLGTQFGVDATDDDQTHVQVFQGVVAVRSGNGSGADQADSVVTLHAGEATQIGVSGRLQKLVNTAPEARRFATVRRHAIAPSGGGLLHRWSFDDGSARDSVGTSHGRLFGSAIIKDGGLVLDGVNSYLASEALGKPLGPRTLVTWLRLANLQQRSGAVISLIKLGGDASGQFDGFDAIVYGERTPNQWLSGSEYFQRSPVDNGGVAETSLEPVMLAIAYDEQQISIYRNGMPYARYAASLKSYPSTGYVLMGLRHPDVEKLVGSAEGADGFLAATLEEARLYNTALRAETIEELYQLGPDRLPLEVTGSTASKASR